MAAEKTVTVFCPSKLGPISEKLVDPKRFSLRPLQRNDYEKGFGSLLGQLTDIEGLTKDDFEKRFDELKKDGNYFIVVIEDLEKSKIVATATLLVENKFVHKNGKVGHIEDVVVDSAYRKHRFGLVIARGCYKIILDCNDGNVGFYERCGFKKKELQMALYTAKL